MRPVLLIALLAAAPATAADDGLTGAQVLARATEAAGGEGWAKAKTLTLVGTAIFYGPAGAAPRSRADDYRMYRVFDPSREASHAAEGKVRIIATDHGRILFTVGYDGTITWNERGVVPKAEADAFWSSNFGFGIIRHAADPGFKADRVPDDAIDGHKLYMVRLTDPEGGVTLFGIDQSSFAIRTMGFTTPKGWHQRVYDDFVALKHPRWLQARHVTLYYNGVKANEVFWRDTRVNAALDDALFAPPK